MRPASHSDELSIPVPPTTFTYESYNRDVAICQEVDMPSLNRDGFSSIPITEVIYLLLISAAI